MNVMGWRFESALFRRLGGARMASSARYPPRVEADVDGSPRLCRATDQRSHSWLQKFFSFGNKSAVFNVLYNTMS